jgi:hypothetical protein
MNLTLIPITRNTLYSFGVYLTPPKERDLIKKTDLNTADESKPNIKCREII